MARLHETSSSLSVRVSPELMKQLDQLALAEGRTRSFVAEEALKRYVKEESWQVQAIHDALEKAEAGKAKFAPHDEVKTWLKSWGSSATSTSPKCK